MDIARKNILAFEPGNFMMMGNLLHPQGLRRYLVLEVRPDDYPKFNCIINYGWVFAAILQDDGRMILRNFHTTDELYGPID